jgi:hypothetical protein
MVEAIHKTQVGVENALNLLKVLAEKFNNQELEEAAKEYAEDNSLCYDCECELEVEEWNENRPFGDTYAEEGLSKRVCPECGKEFGSDLG